MGAVGEGFQLLQERLVPGSAHHVQLPGLRQRGPGSGAHRLVRGGAHGHEASTMGVRITAEVLEERIAARALLDGHGDVRRQPPGREVVQEEERLGALHQDVVDAVVDQILADGVVDVAVEGDFQLGADAVGAGHQHGVAGSERLQAEQPAEAADLRQHVRREGALGQRPDAPDDLVAGVDVDAARLIVHRDLRNPGWS